MNVRLVLALARRFVAEYVQPVIERDRHLCVRPTDYGFRVKESHGQPATAEEGLKDLADEATQHGLTLYLHYPYCAYHCTFCHYAVKVADVSQRAIAQPVATLQREIAARLAVSPALGQAAVSSIYIGGGTPALMAGDELADLLGTVWERFAVQPDVEVTIEGTPQSFTPDKISLLRDQGVTRTNLGIQVLDDAYLAGMNRRHTAVEALAALERLLTAGFPHVNVDLIYGFPDITAEKFVADVKTVLQRRPTSVTTYRLRLERADEGRTSLYGLYQRQPERFPTPAETYSMQVAARMLLTDAGYVEGPIGWYTLPGAYPLVYRDRWQQQRALAGFGWRAYSYSQCGELHNLARLADYTAAVRANRLPITSAVRYSASERARRCINFQLKASGKIAVGLPLSHPTIQTYLQGLVEQQLLQEQGGNLTLTPAGIVLLEEII